MDKTYNESQLSNNNSKFEKDAIEEGELSDDGDNYQIDLLRIKQQFETQQVTKQEIEEDGYESVEEECSDEDTDCAELDELVPGQNLLDSILSQSQKKNCDKVNKGRIIDRENTELEFLLPTDLEEQLRRITIKEDEPLEQCGTMILRIEDTQTITFKSTRIAGVMDMGTAIFDGHRNMIGIIGYIFGKADDMCYQVICKDMDTCNALRPGDNLLCAPGATGAYFRGEEAVATQVQDDSDEYFSDDDKEREHTQKKDGPNKGKKRPANQRNKNKAQKGGVNQNPFVVPSMRRSNNSQGYMMPPQGNRGQAPIQSYNSQTRPQFNAYQPPPFNMQHMPPFNWQPTQFNAQPTQFNAQQPQFNGQQPQFNGQQPQFNGQQPQFNGQQPQFNGQQPQFNAQHPPPSFQYTNFPPPNNAGQWPQQRQWPPRTNQR